MLEGQQEVQKDDSGEIGAIVNRELKIDDDFDLGSAWEGSKLPDPEDDQAQPEPDTPENNATGEELGQAAPDGGPKGSEETSPTTQLTPPAHFNTAEKKLFAGLDDKSKQLVRDVVRRSDQEVSRYRSDLDRRAAYYNELDEVLAPRAEQFRSEGLTPTQAVAQLFQLSDFAAQDPYGFIQMLAKQRNLDLEAAALGEIPEQAQPETDPRMLALQNHVGALQNRIEQRETAEQEQKRTVVRSEIDEFRRAIDENGEPKYPYLDSLQTDMAALIRSESANTLEDAYEQASWANPAVRQARLDDRDAKAAQDRQEQDRTKAERARRAAKSLDGGVGGTDTAAPISLRDSLEQKFNAY